MEPEHDDLAQLRSLNEGDMSAEMYNFHEAISEMQRAEEEVLDNHKAICDYMQHAQQRTAQLLQLTRDVDYDQDVVVLFAGLETVEWRAAVPLRGLNGDVAV
ncbi:hypothetical protein MSG28_011283 [Choristoneura fumiferana]|uniref:Uncharacterized protein n=1 Tax=Choristoneura fumiferana TaxID=7141 RepID=A0ACC0KR41_CHOFU|nr:hypothetical protein MSG28_011283 [Choristoneura fumiferana]